MVNVGGAVMSPDGEWVLFSKRELDWDENERTTKWYLIPSSGGEAFEYIGEEGGGSFQFSPDGKFTLCGNDGTPWEQLSNRCMQPNISNP